MSTTVLYTNRDKNWLCVFRVPENAEKSSSRPDLQPATSFMVENRQEDYLADMSFSN